MIKKATGKTLSKPGKGELPAAPVLAPDPVDQDHLASIQELGEKIVGHIRFVATMGALPGTSAEARARAITAFHGRLVALEKALGQTLEDLRLE